MKCSSCDFFVNGSPSECFSHWDSCRIAEKKGIGISDFQQFLLNKECKYFDDSFQNKIKEKERKEEIERKKREKEIRKRFYA